MGSRNKRLVGEGLAELTRRLGFCCDDGLAERQSIASYFRPGSNRGLARARAGRKDAASELTKTAGKLKAGEWPYPVVELYLGRKSVQALEAAASKPEERCEAQFYIGELYLTRNARAPAMKALQAAVDICPKDFIEYRGAVEEPKRLK
jgi:lipoprotein NlpI